MVKRAGAGALSLRARMCRGRDDGGRQQSSGVVALKVSMLAALVAGAVLNAMDVSAQQPGPRAGVLLAPRAGWVVPVGQLGQVQDMSDGSP